MRTIGILLGGNPYTVAARMNEIYNLEEKLAKVGYTAFLIRKGGGPDPPIPLLFHENPSSRTSVIAALSIVFFPSPRPNFGEFRFPSSNESLYPVKVRFPNPELYFDQIPDPV